MSLRTLTRLAKRSAMPVRIGVCRITHETNAWNPVPSEVVDFERAHLLAGEALLAACGPDRSEVDGYVANAELSGAVAALREVGAEPVPLMSAWAIPSGPISDDLLQAFHRMLQAALDAAGTLDGVVIAMHGAMTSVHDHLPEVELLERIRAHVGPNTPVVLTLDLHAHLTPRKVAAVTAVVAYQTNPHRDHRRVGFKAGLLATALARGEARMHQSWRMLPMILGGGTTLDFLPTMRPAFALLHRLDRRPEVLHASLFMSHLWHDAPDLGWSTLVVTDAALDPDGKLADQHCEALADALWAVRDILPPTFSTPEEALETARRSPWRRRLGVIAFSDASDNVAAGGHGANSNLLAALLANGQGLLSYVPLKDPVAVARLAEVTPGSPVDLEVGGTVDPERNPSVRVRGRLVRHAVHPAFGRMVVVDAGHVQLVLTEAPPLAMKPSFYGDVGLAPWKADIIVAKSFFHFRWYFLAIARRVIYVKTLGITDLDLPLQTQFAIPVHPQQSLEDWRPEDRLRRGLGDAS